MNVNLIYKTSKRFARQIRGIAPLIILTIVFLFLPAFDVLIKSQFTYWILLIAKTVIGFSIALILIFKYFDEIYDLIDNFQVEEKNINTWVWIFKKENII
ncbi:hypothetical protein [Spiroplasma culicicola]|uniref:Uncharacterized protein n=1 Tax=Spiroplasma culicicola AES-1 TaxID=1276246 RepID=W6A7T3_9MOLU|nr:hypothetical protein [Spiroplasma culicicola]AHI52935.1 hypothetical protein SCULI_v1c05940 [Spiroplasma culicicola AES-1]